MPMQRRRLSNCERWVVRLFTLALISTCAFSAWSQTLTITPTFVTNASIVTLSDFNITGSGSATELFRVTISAATPTDVTMSFTFESSSYNAVIVDAKTKPFTLVEPRTFTNRDFGSTTTFADVKLDYLNFNTNLISELQNTILRTGRLPNDSYRFNLRLEAVNNPVVNDTQILTLDVSNPTTLSLVSPGGVAGGGECYELFTTLPLFQWDSNADRFEITICEQLPTNSTPEDVMQNQPRVQMTLVSGIDFTGKPSFLYPASGVFPLQEGHTYYWQVNGVVDSPSGQVRLPSEIWCFNVASLGNPGTGLSTQQLLNALTNALGGGDFDALFAAGGPLEGYSPTGVMMVDGKRVDMAALMQLLNQFKAGSRKVKGITVE